MDLQQETNEDRISKLPDNLLHNIISLIPTREAVCTSIISKRWRHLYKFLPTLNFNQTLFIDPSGEGRQELTAHERWIRKERFKFFVDRTLMLYDPSMNVKSFCIQVTSLYPFPEDEDLANRLIGWIDWPVMHNVQVLDITIMHRRIPNLRYRLPPNLFSCRSITSLHLEQCEFKDFGEVNLVSLKTLYIHLVRVANQTMRLVVTNCRVLEELSLIRCEELTALEGSNIQLRYLKIHNCHDLEKFDMYVPNLKSFNCFRNNPSFKIVRGRAAESLLSIEKLFLSDFTMGYPNQEFRISWIFMPSSSIVFQSLKTLSLEQFYISEDLFQSLISKCPCLENLKIKFGLKVKHLKIDSDTLKSLEIYYCFELEKIDINAPNLVSLEYTGKILEPFLINSSPNLEAKLIFGMTNTDAFQSLKLRNLLKSFNNAGTLTLVAEWAEIFLLPEELLESHLPPLFNLKHLKLQTMRTMMSYTDILIGSLSLSAHLETLTLVLGYLKINLKFRPMDNSVEMEDFPMLNWTHLSWDYFRLRLKEVEVRNLNGNYKERELIQFIGGDLMLSNVMSTPSSDYFIWKA